MNRWRGQAGEGRAGCIFWTLILVLGVMVSIEVIPKKIATVQLKDKMREAAQLMPRGTEKHFVNYIVAQAAELDLPVTKKNIKIRKTKQRVVMDVEFVIPLDLIVTTYNWNVHLHVDRDIFLI